MEIDLNEVIWGPIRAAAREVWINLITLFRLLLIAETCRTLMSWSSVSSTSANWSGWGRRVTREQTKWTRVWNFCFETLTITEICYFKSGCKPWRPLIKTPWMETVTGFKEMLVCSCCSAPALTPALAFAPLQHSPIICCVFPPAWTTRLTFICCHVRKWKTQRSAAPQNKRAQFKGQV